MPLKYTLIEYHITRQPNRSLANSIYRCLRRIGMDDNNARYYQRWAMGLVSGEIAEVSVGDRTIRFHRH